MKKENYRILVINPGSTSTKIGVFDNEKCIFEKVVRHERSELDACGGLGVLPQKNLRKELILKTLEESGIDIDSLDATCGRAGRLPPMRSGTYQVDKSLMDAVPNPLVSTALLGMIIAKEIGDAKEIPSFIVDPATVCELWDIAFITGIPEIVRGIQMHTLNQKAVARRAASEIGKAYDECKFVVAHVGGGVTVGAHRYGRIVDGTHGSGGEGPLGPERAGAVPGLPLTQMCFSGKYSQSEIEEKFLKRGGILAHLGTSDMREVEKMIAEGDERARLVYDAFAYNVAKTIGSMFPVLGSEVDGIVLTGGIIYSEMFQKMLIDRIARLGRIFVYPGEMELEALAFGALRVLQGEEKAQLFEDGVIKQ